MGSHHAERRDGRAISRPPSNGALPARSGRLDAPSLDRRLLLGLADSTIDSSAGRYVLEQIETARSLYLGHHFDRHDEWTSPTKNFDIGVGFNDLGVQVRVVGQQRSVRMGLVGNGPSDVGGWETYRGAPTQ